MTSRKSVRITKIQIAKAQIETAIDLFFNEDDRIAVLTLAGAGEEILGNVLSRKKSRNMLGVVYSASEERQLSLDPKDIANIANRTRNALKHAKFETEDEIDFDPEEAVIMLLRATINYQLEVGTLTARMEDYLSWLRTERPRYIGKET